MKVRRVVTGHAEDGGAIVTSDEMVEGISVAIAPGFEFHSLWGNDEPMRYPDDGSQPDYSTWFPPDNGFRFMIGTIPPDSVAPPPPEMSDEEMQEMMESLSQEAEAKLPGLLSTMEPENPGFHCSDTIDMLFVVSGELVLELDDGVTVDLKSGDSIVQSGTRHAWRNPGSKPCVFVGVLVGAQRDHV